VLWVAILLPPLLLPAFAKEAFRLPKLLASEWLGLASLLPLAFRLRSAGRVGWRDLGRLPALLAVAPLVAVATLGLAVGRHPFHLHEALADLWIGAACLAGWSAGLSRKRWARLMTGLLVPATLLALLGILQFHGLYRPFEFEGPAIAGRLAVTSLAGNPGDLAAYLVLPCLLAQWILVREWRARRGQRAPLLVVVAAVLAICLYAMAVTQTLSALAAVAAGSLILWACLAPRRLLAPAAGLGVGLAVVLVLVVPPLRGRVMEKAGRLAQGDWNSLLTGRLDGWRAAAWMLGRHPLAGAGQGGFEAEFVPAKLALLDSGARFFEGAVDVTFDNAHNEILDVGADLGVPGLLALGWGLWLLWGALRRRTAGAENAADAADAADAEGKDRPSAALAWGGTVALALLSLFQFPFRIALTAFPALLFLAWVFGARPEREEDEEEEEEEERTGIPGTTLGWLLAALVVVALVLQGNRWRDRLLGSAMLRQVELVSISAASSGHAPGNLLPSHLELLRRAADLDPSEVGVPIARGSQFLLFGDPRAALPEYRAALALQPKPEIYADLGRAYLASGDLDEARRNFRLAVRLDPTLSVQVPEEFR
jgi:O-antigen ligase